MVNHPRLDGARSRYARPALVALVRRVLMEARERIVSVTALVSGEEVVESVLAAIAREWEPSPRRVINATGTVLHTNLGRAPLSRAAVAAMATAGSYSDLEYDLDGGARGSRQEHIAPLMNLLLGSESALMTGNNAGAVVLMLAALAKGREVIVSRGQAVEIGGGFRVPQILRQSGARLVEVGTTNRTRLADYAEAVGPRTAAILHVHPSNFSVVGFTESVPIEVLGKLAHDRGVLLLVDNGSGALVDTRRFGLAHEPMPAEALSQGADVVAFSTDKLLGGPQGGVLAGRSDLVQLAGRHPLARALRPDKLAIAALNATLRDYIRGDLNAIPVLWMLGRTIDDIEAQARYLAGEISNIGFKATTEPGESAVGGGSLPAQTLRTCVAAIRPPGPVTRLATALRRCAPPVIGRVERGRLLLDPRTLQPGDADELLAAFSALSTH